jgi:hypothetical protein
MGRYALTTLLAAIACLAAGGIASEAALATPTNPVIHGVVDNPTGPAAEVDVLVYPAGGGAELASTQTDAGGNYSVEVPGDFLVSIEFIPAPEGAGTSGRNALPTFYALGVGTVFEEGAGSLQLEGTNSYVIDEVLLAGGEITGKVKDTVTKAPLAGQSVSLEAFGSQIAKATTAADGSFKFVRLDSKLESSYRVCFASTEFRYANYCEELTVNPASNVVVEPPLVMTGTLAGALVTPAGSTYQGEVEVAAYDQSGQLANAGVFEGTYSLPAPPGSYRLYFVPIGLPARYYLDRATLACAEALTVSSEVVTHAANEVLSPAAPTCSPSGGGETPPGGGGSPPGGGSPSGGAPGGGEPAGASASAIASALSLALGAGSALPTVAAVLKSGAIALSFAAPSAGAAAISWYELPPGAHLASAHRPKPVLVASGHAAFAKAGLGKIRLVLTAAGRHLLRSAHRSVSLVAVGTFKPTGGAAVKHSRHITLRRGSTHKR